MNLEYKYSFPLAEAKERCKALGEYLQNRHHIGVTWDPSGDRATIKGKYMVVTIEGSVVLKEGVVLFDGKDPGFLWRNKAKEYLLGKLQKYLDPKTPVDQLPRR
jgi:hypothetical protein